LCSELYHQGTCCPQEGTELSTPLRGGRWIIDGFGGKTVLRSRFSLEMRGKRQSVDGGIFLETIAVYWESRVKVYSITELAGLTLAQFTFPNIDGEQWGRRLIELESVIPRFELVIQDSIDSTLSQISLLFTGAIRHTVEEFSEKWMNEPSTSLEFSAPLEMVFLHGPHFQDRYGIVDIAFSALHQKNIDIIAAGCAGTTVYIVLPDLMGHVAKSVLTDTFIIPEGS